jgi:tetratricopeptide (TPR) repeat protein
VAAFTEALPWSSIWLFGTQVLLLGAEQEPSLDPLRFPQDGQLGAALAALGLASPAQLLARHVSAGADWPAVARPLSDRDPWTVYRPARGQERLLDLAHNLALLRAGEGAPPAAWTSAAGEGAQELGQGTRDLRRAREAWAVERAALLGLSVPASGLERDVDAPLARARGRLPGDPELVALEREVLAGRGRAQGLARLAADPSPEGARAAAFALREAARQLPERADAHLYLALAFERMGEPAAAELALTLALELCPGVMETPPGRSASNLGFPATQRLRTKLEALRRKSTRAGA